MHRNSPQIIGIAGGSCAGKSWLADRLAEHLGATAVRISLDSFYRDRSDLSPRRRARLNFDHPRTIDWPGVEEALARCAARESFSVPRYDFKTHARELNASILKPAPVVIVDGLWLLRRAAVRKFLTMRIYIRGATDLCVARRIQRDTRERGRSPEEIRRQLERFTLPMFERFVAPQEKWADVVLDAPVSAADILEILNRIAEKRCPIGI